ncbi:vacuolar sorting protein [Dimargaris cristalligena]|uniref:Vacuolar sorting protein n=1 Tax=Dimargaris cristalligena TaxID=215637 RepID=A0A4V1J4B5_9FUNG|nr:vacuolar sorting protein [Dimargaris cristalligena]|eukprot:RKP34979.1 vacuolar sorting protein [Dimargaris cristalligena]
MQPARSTPDTGSRSDDPANPTPLHPDFTIFQELARQSLTNVLDSVRGTKVLVVDPALSPSLSLIAEFSLLKEHGVEKVYHLQPDRVETDCRNILYLSRPQVEHMQWIANHIRTAGQERPDQPHEYSLFLTPRRTLVCDRILEEQGVLGELVMGEYHLDLVPLERDLATLELNDCFKTLLVDQVPTSLFAMGRALMRLQAVYGFFPRIVGKGDAAKQLADMLIRMRRELSVDEPIAAQSSTISQTIDTLVILDRSVDLLSPLCTQLTYEGLIDERFAIRNSLVEVDAHLARPSNPSNPPAAATASAAGSSSSNQGPAASAGTNKKAKVSLNSKDALYAELRDLNFSVVGGWLHRAAKRINDDYQGRHQAKTVTQIRQFIGKLGNIQAEHQSLRLHTYLAEEIYKYTLSAQFNRNLEFEQTLLSGASMSANSPFTDYIEELIGNEAPLTQVLRLLCLQSVTSNGIKRKMYDFWRREIIQTYGYAHLVTLERLARLRLFFPNDSGARSTYPALKKALHLVVDDVDEGEPHDAAFVYSGFAPPMVRLIQCVIRDPVLADQRPASPSQGPGPTSSIPVVNTTGWKGYEDVIHLLPGQAFDCVQTVEDANPYIIQSRLTAKDKPTTVIFFVGGCTFAEIAAIRFLARHNNRRFLIATTHIINGNSLLESIMEND